MKLKTLFATAALATVVAFSAQAGDHSAPAADHSAAPAATAASVDFKKITSEYVATNKMTLVGGEMKEDGSYSFTAKDAEGKEHPFSVSKDGTVAKVEAPAAEAAPAATPAAE
jgi:Cu/Ag efflux protein CusF